MISRDEPFTLRSDGSLDARLSDAEAEALRRVAADILDELKDTADPGMRRLFPPAYEKEPELEQEFASLTRDELLERKRNGALAVIASIDGGKTKRGLWSARLDEETSQSWLGLINDARLILGTRLNVTDDEPHEPLPPDHPDAPSHNIYIYLSALEWSLVETLMSGLPETGTE
jgi:hypothetical protein